jgi:uncharacterized protein|tara:strand:- start:521 stop:817 length:297 start_codon:yes stop_codon:yes gene_type:complete
MKLTINNKVVPVEIMDTPEKISTGMMGRDSLDGGMLFLFDKADERSFWMKNCLIPLDIIFITGNKITKVHKNCEPCTTEPCESYTGFADKVLELASRR